MGRCMGLRFVWHAKMFDIVVLHYSHSRRMWTRTRTRKISIIAINCACGCVCGGLWMENGGRGRPEGAEEIGESCECIFDIHLKWVGHTRDDEQLSSWLDCRFDLVVVFVAVFVVVDALVRCRAQESSFVMAKDLLIQNEINIYIQCVWLPPLPPLHHRHDAIIIVQTHTDTLASITHLHFALHKSKKNRWQMNSELFSFQFTVFGENACHKPISTRWYSLCDTKKLIQNRKNSQSSHACSHHRCSLARSFGVRGELWTLNEYKYLLSWHIFRLQIKILIS